MLIHQGKSQIEFDYLIQYRDNLQPFRLRGVIDRHRLRLHAF